MFDAQSRQLILRDAANEVEVTTCPYCHQLLRDDSASNDHTRRPSTADADPSFVNPEYFRMLHGSNVGSAESSRPASPRRRWAPQIELGESSSTVSQPRSGESTENSTDPEKSPHGISAAAFSQDYFKKFFVVEGELGRGGKGVVFLVKHVLDNVSLGQFACKRVPVGDDHQWLEKVLIEVQLLQNLSHQNLVSYRHVWLEDVKLTNFGPSVPCAFILQQFCNAGDLQQYIISPIQTTATAEQLKNRMRRRSKGDPEPPLNLQAPRKLKFDDIYLFFSDITEGLNHLHTNGYIHRDLKPSNCLLHKTGDKMRVLVSDFGEVQLENKSRRSSGATGTISYCAPEVLQRSSPDGPFGNFTNKSDVFSLGMILYFMCFGRLPYPSSDSVHEENEDIEQLRAEISAWRGIDEAAGVHSGLEIKMYKFLKRLLSLNPTERPSAEDILLGLKSGGIGDSSLPGPSGSVLEEIRSDSPRPEKTPTRRSGGGGGVTSSLTRAPPPRLRPQSMSRSSSQQSAPVPIPSPPLSASSVSSSLIIHPSRPLSSHSQKQKLLPPAPSPTSMLPRLLRRQPLVSRREAVLLLRIAIFVVKLASLMQGCSPAAVNPWVGWPLVLVAAGEMVGSAGDRGFWEGWGIRAVLLSLHVGMLGAAQWWGALCVRGRRREELGQLGEW